MVPQFVKLLQSPNTPDKQFTTYPWVLYQDDDTKKMLFGSQVIVNVSTYIHHADHAW